MLANPYLEGLLAIVVGASLMAAGHIYGWADVVTLGGSVSILGLGYLGGRSVPK